MVNEVRQAAEVHRQARLLTTTGLCSLQACFSCMRVTPGTPTQHYACRHMHEAEGRLAMVEVQQPKADSVALDHAM